MLRTALLRDNWYANHALLIKPKPKQNTMSRPYSSPRNAKQRSISG